MQALLVLALTIVTTVAGVPGNPGATDGPAATARFDVPRGVAVGRDDSVYVAESGNHVIRKIANGVVTTINGVQ